MSVLSQSLVTQLGDLMKSEQFQKSLTLLEYLITLSGKVGKKESMVRVTRTIDTGDHVEVYLQWECLTSVESPLGNCVNSKINFQEEEIQLFVDLETGTFHWKSSSLLEGSSSDQKEAFPPSEADLNN